MPLEHVPFDHVGIVPQRHRHLRHRLVVGQRVAVDIKDKQRQRLQKTIAWAQRIRAELQPILEAHGDRVHFRPSSTGVAMVGLLPERPQRGKSGLRDLARVAADFEAVFAAHCKDIDHGRVTGEKKLQSWLIRDAYTHDRKLDATNTASANTNAPVELVFTSDEISLPTDTGKIVCDILALRVDGGRTTPVLLELKDDRMLTRLVEQVENYSALIDDHADLFTDLFGALLGQGVVFDGPTEKWTVWPAAGDDVDPRETNLRERGIRVVGYREDGAGGYGFRVGQAAR